jgi:hypothetical protein
VLDGNFFGAFHASKLANAEAKRVRECEFPRYEPAVIRKAIKTTKKVR